MLDSAYPLVKVLHIGAVILSGAGFAVRCVAGWRGAGWVRSRAARTLPHLVDTVLLATALALAVSAGFHPGNSPWLTAKLGAVLAYIALGMVALKPGRALRVRIAAGLGAFAVFAYIVAVALTKRPWPFAAG